MTKTISELPERSAAVTDAPAESLSKRRPRKKKTVEEVIELDPAQTVSAESQDALVAAPPISITSGDMPVSPPKTHQRTQRHKKHNKTAQHSSAPSPQASYAQTASPEFDFTPVILVAENHNKNEEMCWKVQAIYKTDKIYLHLCRKELNESQLEVFEDNRVTEAVMRGSKPPSVDEQWRKIYRDEMKVLQRHLHGMNIWIADTIPEKKHTLHWGEKSSRAQSVDKDSQEFFLKREQKRPNRNEQWRKKTNKGSPRFG